MYNYGIIIRFIIRKYFLFFIAVLLHDNYVYEVIKLKGTNILKKSAAVLLSLIIALMTLAPVGFAVSYPAGVTPEQAQNAMSRTDAVFSAVLGATEGKSISEVVIPMLLGDGTLSSLAKMMYSMGEENAATFSTIGLAISPADIAKNLGNYPDVQARLMSAESWSTLDLTGAVWGVSTVQEFTDAAVALFLPMNELLYTILCGGSYSLNPLVGIQGDKGYEKALMRIFAAMGMESVTAPSAFYSQAQADKTSMIRNLIKDVVVYLELICSAPATMLSKNLPGIAHFIQNGGLDNAVAKLVEPLKIKVLGITTPIKIGSMMDLAAEGEGGMSLDVNIDIGSFTASGTLLTAPFDLNELASLATQDVDSTYIVNTADSFIYIFRWILETLRLNMGTIPQMLSGLSPDMDAGKISQLLTGLFSKSTDEIMTVYIGLLNAQSGKVNPYVWSFNPVSSLYVTYTPNLGPEKFQRVVDGADALINDFVKESGEAENFRKAVAPEIYSNALVTKLVSGVYSILTGEQMGTFLSLAGLDVSPAELGRRLSEDEYSEASAVLRSISDYSELEELEVSWGFKNGNRDGFIRAVSACFRPLEGLLRMVLCGDSLNVLGGIPFYGSDGYNTAVIPILEALGCSYDEIRSFDEYRELVGQTDVMLPIVQSVVSLAERFIDYPVYTLTGILPNLMYFINNGGIEICINNLLYPVVSIMDSLGLSGQFDFSALLELDTDKIMDSLMADLDLGIKLPELDLKQFGSMGTLVTAQTKRTQLTEPMTVQYLQADKTGVMVTLMRYLVETIKMPGNESIVESFMTGANGDSDLFATYSSDIGAEMADMTVDETVEWLYKLFFRERATVEENNLEDYTPTIIYKEKKSVSWGAVLVVLIIIAAGAAAAYINRKKLMELLEKLRDRKSVEE